MDSDDDIVEVPAPSSQPKQSAQLVSKVPATHSSTSSAVSTINSSTPVIIVSTNPTRSSQDTSGSTVAGSIPMPSPLTQLPSMPAPAASPPPGKATGSSPYSGMFGKEIRCLMYGLGDSKTPYKDSVELVEQLVLKFVVDLVTKAQDVGSRPGGRVAIEDIVFVLRKDRAKFARVRELLTVNDELKKAKKAIAELDSVPAT